MKQFRLIAYEKIYFIEELRSYFNENDVKLEQECVKLKL